MTRHAANDVSCMYPLTSGQAFCSGVGFDANGTVLIQCVPVAQLAQSVDGITGQSVGHCKEFVVESVPPPQVQYLPKGCLWNCCKVHTLLAATYVILNFDWCSHAFGGCDLMRCTCLPR